MEITHKKRKELDALSKEIFGVPSKWNRILKRGTEELITHEEEKVIKEKTETEAEVKGMVSVPTLLKNGCKQYRQKYYTLETLEALMLDIKAKRDEFLAKMKKMDEEKKAKEEQEKLAKSIQESVAGSAAAISL